jgi:hypothetical protein
MDEWTVGPGPVNLQYAFEIKYEDDDGEECFATVEAETEDDARGMFYDEHDGEDVSILSVMELV